jgi:hypothetical protein
MIGSDRKPDLKSQYRIGSVLGRDPIGPARIFPLLEYIYTTYNTTYNFKLKVRDQFFMNHFKIQQKNFKTYADFCRAKAFFIRMHRPSLNDQKDHKLLH